MALSPQRMAELKAIAEKASSPAKTAQSQGATYTGGLSQERFTQLKNIAQSAPTVRTQAPSAPQDKSSFFQKASSAIGNLGIGALKGAGHTIASIGELGAKALSPIDKLTGAKPIQSGDTEKSLNYLSGSQNSLTPTNTAQKVGSTLEQVGEFFVPGKWISEATKGLEVANDASKIKKFLSLGSRAIVEGASNASIAAAQGGDKQQVATTGLVSAALPVFSKAMSSIIEKVPETAWSAILKRTPLAAIKNPLLSKQASDSGIIAATRKGVLSQAQQGIQAIEVTLDDLLSKSSKIIDGNKVAGYLDDLSSAYSGIPGEGSSVDVIQNIANEIRAKGSIAVKDANQLKRDIYDIVANTYGKGMLEVPAKREAQKLIAYGIKKEIENVLPETIPLNAKQAVFIQIKDAIKKTIARNEGKGIAGSGVGLYDLLTGGIGTAIGTASGNPLLGIGAVALKKTAESPAVLSSVSALAEYFNKLSPTKKLLFYDFLRSVTGDAASKLPE